ncbi:MAG: hypothetical protein JNM56_09460 [Planctomycetia bacterium]|nr:hypothetical protein [Planctomycetia bacterium]
MPDSEISEAAPGIPARVLRLLLIAAVLWLGWQTLLSYCELLSGPPPVVAVDADTAGLPEFPPPPALQLFDGVWSFGDRAFRLEIGPVGVEQIPVRLRQPPDAPAPAAEAADLERRLLKLAQVLAKPQALGEGRQRYDVKLGDARGALFTSGDGPAERVLHARLAFPGHDARWQLLELSPRSASEPTSSTGDHLLPLAEGLELLGQRREATGRVMCELVSSALSPAELWRHWQVQGWSVEPYPDQPADAGPWYCRRAGDAVHVWLRTDGQPDGRRLLILIRMPADASDASTKRR